MKLENKCKRKGKTILLALEEKTLRKNWRKTTKKLIGALTDRIERERECLCVFENFLKSKLNMWESRF